MEQEELNIAEEVRDMNSGDFYRFMCDVIGVTYYTDKEKLIEMINEKMNQVK